MKKAPTKVVLDTNILISAFMFGGNPRRVLFEVLAKNIYAVTSQILMAELFDTLGRKFKVLEKDFQIIDSQIRKNFTIVFPLRQISVVRDIDDNRVIEAAVEGECDYIVTGDKDLLLLGKYNNIKILTPSEFLEMTQD